MSPPPRHAVVAGYVAELANDRRPAGQGLTITRRLAAIGEDHKVAGHPNPCTEPLPSSLTTRTSPCCRSPVPATIFQTVTFA